MELTREEVEKLADPEIVMAFKPYTCLEVAEIAKQLLREMIEEKVWQNAPKEATRAHVNYFAGKQILQEYKSNWYERPLPKSPAREIAERKAKEWRDSTTAGGDHVADIIESAINEYKEREK